MRIIVNFICFYFFYRYVISGWSKLVSSCGNSFIVDEIICVVNDLVFKYGKDKLLWNWSY